MHDCPALHALQIEVDELVRRLTVEDPQYRAKIAAPAQHDRDDIVGDERSRRVALLGLNPPPIRR